MLNFEVYFRTIEMICHRIMKSWWINFLDFVDFRFTLLTNLYFFIALDMSIVKLYRTWPCFIILKSNWKNSKIFLHDNLYNCECDAVSLKPTFPCIIIIQIEICFARYYIFKPQDKEFTYTFVLYVLLAWKPSFVQKLNFYKTKKSTFWDQF